MSVGKPELDYQDHAVAPVRPTKKRRCMAHCKRFWWIYLLALICIVVLVTCLV